MLPGFILQSDLGAEPSELVKITTTKKSFSCVPILRSLSQISVSPSALRVSSTQPACDVLDVPGSSASGRPLSAVEARML